MPSNTVEQIESALFALVGSLARTLIQLEVTPDRLAQISRTAFVKAAALQATKRVSGRPHIARIAALTGLSRLEVKKIVESNYLVGRRPIDCSPRAIRVLAAWQTCSPYAHRSRPRKLKIKGRNASFESLCRAYSGDIPYKVILDELVRTNRVKLNKAGTIASVSPARRRSHSEEKNAQALRFAAAFTSAALQDEQVLVRRLQRVLTTTSVSAAYVEQAVSGKVNDVLDQIPRLFPKETGSSRSGVCVYALVSRDPRLTRK